MVENRILRLKEVRKLCGLSPATIWRKERDGSFPRRYQISKRSVGWQLFEIEQWINSREIASKGGIR